MRESDVLIIGAGMAGASCGYWLAEDKRVILLEMEAQPGYHTTGRSVAVYTEAYGPRTIRALAKVGRSFFTDQPQGFSDALLSRPQGLFFIARQDQMEQLDRALADVRELSPNIAMITPDQAVAQLPLLRRDYLGGAFLDPNALSLDVDAIHQGYLRGLKAKGGEVCCKAEVTALDYEHGKWVASTPQGAFAAPVVINAAGAWTDKIAELAGARPVGLVPKRRTVIAFVPPDTPLGDNWPVLIDVDEELVLKVDAGTVLASPGDETPVPPQDIQPEELDIAITVDRVEKATVMQVPRLQRTWAGLRSFVADKVPVVGFAPDLDGFFWCAGQGGYGIETSYGMGRASAALAQGRSLPSDLGDLGVIAADLAPQRLWTDGA